MLLPSRVSTRYYKPALMAVCLFIAVFAGGSAFCGSVGNDLSLTSEINRQSFAEKRFEHFDNFIVYLKDTREPVFHDEHGTDRKGRILLCNVVVELNQGMELSKEKVELRKIIYKTVKELSGPPKIRRKLKKIIKIRLNNFMESETIKKVYFIKFVLL